MPVIFIYFSLTFIGALLAYLSVNLMCAVLVEARRRHRMPWNCIADGC